MTVREWMSAEPVTVSSDTGIADARQLMDVHGFRHLPVVDDGRLVGIVSDRDVGITHAALEDALRQDDARRLLGDDQPVGSVMSPSPLVIGADHPIREAARLLVSRRVNALPVVDDHDHLVGIITSVDCLLATLDQLADDRT